MIIDNQNYLPIQEFGQVGDVTCYLFKQAKANQFYAVTAQSRKTVTGDEIKFLFEQSQNKIFTDFVDYYTMPDLLYVFMKHQQQPTLQQKLDAENCSLPERLQLVKNILERLAILDMPLYFMGNILDSNHVLVSDGLDISFDYQLYDIADFANTTAEQVAEKMADLLALIFDKELQMKAMKQLRVLIQKLRQGRIAVKDEIIQEFYPIYSYYTEHPDIEKQTRQFKQLEKIKKLAKYLGVAIQLGVIALAIAYLVWSILMINDEGEVVQNFQSIGTQEIKDTSLSDSTEDTTNEE